MKDPVIATAKPRLTFAAAGNNQGDNILKQAAARTAVWNSQPLATSNYKGAA